MTSRTRWDTPRGILKSLTIASLLLIASILSLPQEARSAEAAVKIQERPLTMPTYLVDPPGKEPRFYNGRAYQGAQGRIYPYPICESLSNTRVDKTYDMVFIENEYIQVMVFPEIGGRVFGGLDKTNNYDFIYRQHVIKPALIGMLGSWISGGIEWNFPHHHRATAFSPVDYVLEENPDGSATCWIGELEIRHRMKFMLGVTVYPDRSYFEVTFRPFNRTPFAHSFLYFANTGVHTNQDYQVIFPPSTQFGVYHGKNQFTQWPISHEFYNGVDYTSGVDISWWKNHPEWTSIFAWNYQDDFLAGYDHGKKAGTLCYSNHRIAPGKKFWTWSTGPRGQMWDKALTETDGPELELMMGGYSDNQPDYSWLQPYESKYLKQYWYPIRELGGVKNANLDAAVNLDITDNNSIARIAFNTTSQRKNAKVLLKARDKIIFEQQIDISPAKPFAKEVPLPAGVSEYDLNVSLLSAEGEQLVAYQPVKLEKMPMPPTAKPPPPPIEIKTVEQLYLAGMRLEQFYNPSIQPYPYYEEALRRDPNDYRTNVAMGILLLKGGMFEDAERHLKTALDRATYNYTKPRDGEAYYYHGLALKYQHKYDAAYESLYQATWSSAFHSAAYYQLAEINCIKGDFDTAIAHLDRSLSTNIKNTKASDLKAAALRKLGRLKDAADTASNTFAYDPLDFWAGYELYLAQSANGETSPTGGSALGKNKEAAKTLKILRKRMRDDVQNYLELAIDYGNAGLYDQAIDVLSYLDTSSGKKGSTFPMLYYYLAYYWQKKQNTENASKYYQLAAKMPVDYCFPFRLESIDVLQQAMKNNPADARAHYYFGNLLYENQPELAIKYWEKSKQLDDSLALVHRNLGMAYYRTENDSAKAIDSYEKAIALDGSQQRYLHELDLIYDAARVPHEKRLQMLQEHHDAIARNNVSDALAREVLVLGLLGRYDDALNIINNNFFRQWEGISKAYDTYVDAHLLRGLQHFSAKRYDKALADYLASLEFPENLHYAKPYSGGRSCQGYYFVGTAYEALGDTEKAKAAFESAVAERQDEDLSDDYYWRALALKKLGRDGEAKQIFDDLISLGQRRLTPTAMDFFAKFGERQTNDDKLAAAHYLIGLGLLGNGQNETAKTEFAKAAELNINHLWAKVQLSLLQ